MIHPEALTLEEPFSDRKSKGRPTSRSSTKRDPSYFEHVDKKTSTLKSGNKRKAPTKEESIPSEVPRFVVPYIHEYKNVSVDGNCGYRSVAHQIYGSEDQWRRVHTDLHDFIESHLDYWTKIWHKSIDEAWTTLRMVNYCESPCSYKYRMSMDEMGPVIATLYYVILVALDPIQMGTLTYLPLYVPEGIIGPEKLICITFLRSYNHFVSSAKLHLAAFTRPLGYCTEGYKDNIHELHSVKVNCI
ncbi:hypothetical protein POM88_046773 [Heracleum sosnowskyi]|uniref:OTU domain-containing protein n=1 Tax=Heracleum sosnowskyi TaxID=360622 RepID=A0AAD8M776_9APIA|nr:hypothetical protein POM88_046773 [Heracleum sosnowskyi]